MKVALVVAVARNGVIGRDGDLPWRLSSDLKLFRRITMDRPIIMGRRTWSSLKKKPLDGRDNIVVTRDHEFKAPGARVVHTIEDALQIAREAAARRGVDEIMVIGGAEIYKAVLPGQTGSTGRMWKPIRTGILFSVLRQRCLARSVARRYSTRPQG